jgi:enamine deaminase RidA (YjgF/YER057c/UK114 family)
MAGRLEFFNPADLHEPTGPYSHVARIPAGAEVFFVSGQFGIRPDGSIPTHVGEQTDQAFKNLRLALKSQDLDLEHIVKLTTFIVVGQDSREVRKARIKHMGTHHPASTAVYVARLVSPEWLVVVDAIAARVPT